MQGIEFEDLPPNFQAAVTITRGLGLRFLWIDSLCIIQGNKHDWEEQSSIMADIYSGSYLNLAMSRSSNAFESPLGPRWTLWGTFAGQKMKFWQSPLSDTRNFEVRSFGVPMKRGTADQTVRVRLSLSSAHNIMGSVNRFGEHKQTAPLLQRAWVYQERMLSPRTVHLHANEMVWDCRYGGRCACTAIDTKMTKIGDWGASKRDITALDASVDKHGLWRTIVQNYVQSELTYESDRLPALSGLARQFAKHLPQQEEYLAGLWAGDLHRNLFWEVIGYRYGYYSAPTGTKRLNSNLPSWSWASIEWGNGIRMR